MKKYKTLITITTIIVSILIFAFLINVVTKNYKQKQSIINTIKYLEDNYGNGKFAVVKTDKEEGYYKHVLETNYMNADIKISIDDNGTVLEENFIDQYALEKFDLESYNNLSEYIYMKTFERLKEKLDDKMNAVINFSTVRYLDNYGFKNEGKLPEIKDVIKGIEFEQPSIKITDEIKSEEQLLEKMKIIIKILKEDLKEEKLVYKNKFVSYTFDGSTLGTDYNTGYIIIDDYDNFDYIRVNMLNKEVKINKEDL